MSRQAKNQLPASPIEFRRADPDELAKFDPSTKICTMNCGQRSDDPRSPAECKMLCDDCQKVSPKPPAPARVDIIRMAREAGAHEKHLVMYMDFDDLERFAALVAAAEREACAHLAQQYAGQVGDVAWTIAGDIRARSRA